LVVLSATYAKNRSTGDVYFVTGDVLKTKQCYQQAVEARESVGAKEDAAIARLSLASLAPQSGEPQVAWTQAAKAIADGLKKIRAIRQTLSGLYVADLALGDELVALSVINQASDLETSASSRQKSRRPGYAGLVGG